MTRLTRKNEESFLAAEVSIEDQIACAEREVRFLRRVYARRISEGKMTQVLADKEIAGMEAIVATLQSLQPARTTQPSLL